MRAPLQADSATQQRGAAAFALAFACATITALAGVLALKIGTLRIAPAFRLEILPDSTWPAHWLPGAVTAARQQQGAAEQWLHVILVFGVLTVAIACINALIGLLSHANERRYETAVRGIVGASPRQLGRALQRNALVNAGIGVAAGVPMGALAALLIRASWQAPAGHTIPSWALLALCVSLAIASTAARIAAKRFRRAGWLGDALAPAARTVPGWGAEELRALLTAAQLACAVALTTLSLLVWSYADTQAATPSGSRDDTVSVARVALPHALTSQQRREAYASILASLGRNADVVAESMASPGALLGIGKIDKVVSDCGRCGRANMFTPLFAVETQQHVVGAGFFRTTGIALQRGREFRGNASDDHRVIVNDTFARIAFQGQDAIGKRIMVGGMRGEWHRVIGVVADVPTIGLQFFEDDPLTEGMSGSVNAPAVYFPAAAYTPAVFDVVVRTSRPLALAGFDFQPLTAVLARAAAPQTSFARVVTVLGVLLCGAAAIGTFTATMLNVRARRFEIAVRRALGARRRAIWALVYGSLARVVLRGVLTGAVVSVALTRVLEVFVPGLPAFNPKIAALVCAGFALIALLAALPPLRAALRISPAQAQS